MEAEVEVEQDAISAEGGRAGEAPHRAVGGIELPAYVFEPPGRLSEVPPRDEEVDVHAAICGGRAVEASLECRAFQGENRDALALEVSCDLTGHAEHAQPARGGLHRSRLTMSLWGGLHDAGHAVLCTTSPFSSR